MFDILSKYDLEEVYIRDINAELINTYHIIRDDIDVLIEILYDMQNDFIPLSTDERKVYYMEKCERFNDLKVNGNENINIEKASRTNSFLISPIRFDNTSSTHHYFKIPRISRL